jgi:hypothetical protein
MSTRLCVGLCGAEVSGRRKRCKECRRKLQRSLDKRRYHERRAQNASDYEHMDDLPVIDYTVADQAPQLAPPAPGRNPRHDRAAWFAAEHARQIREADEDPELATWEGVMARVTADDRRVSFYPAPDMGRPVRGFRGRGEAPEITSWDVEGMLYRPSPVAGQRAVEAHVHDPWGGRVTPAPPVHSSQLSSAVPYVEARERAEAAGEKRASEAIRAMVESWRR